jgi:hypothetical protein
MNNQFEYSDQTIYFINSDMMRYINIDKFINIYLYKEYKDNFIKNKQKIKNCIRSSYINIKYKNINNKFINHNLE